MAQQVENYLDVQLPEETRKLVESLGLEVFCIELPFGAQTKLGIVGKVALPLSWEFVCDGRYNFFPRGDNSFLLIIHVPKDASEGWENERDEIITSDLPLLICGSQAVVDAVGSQQDAVSWVQSLTIKEGDYPGKMLVQGIEYDVEENTGGPRFFAEIVGLWGFDTLMSNPPSTASAVSDIDAAEGYLKTCFTFVKVKLGDAEHLGWVNLGKGLESTRLVLRDPNGSIGSDSELPLWVKRLMELHPDLQQRLLNACEREITLLQYHPLALVDLLPTHAAATAADGETFEFSFEESRLVDLIGDDGHFRRGAVNLLRSPEDRLRGGSFYGRVHNAVVYGDPGDCRVFVARDETMLFYVPKGASGQFVVLVYDNHASYFLLAVTASNEGRITFAPYNPDALFQKLEHLLIYCEPSSLPAFAVLPLEEGKSA